MGSKAEPLFFLQQLSLTIHIRENGVRKSRRLESEIHARPVLTDSTVRFYVSTNVTNKPPTSVFRTLPTLTAGLRNLF